MSAKWKVMPCPKFAGLHPLHDQRWIATDDAEVEWNHNETEWRLSNGSLICEMRDGPLNNAALIAAAPELLEALRAVMQWFGNEVEDDAMPTEIYEAAHAAIAKAKGGAR